MDPRRQEASLLGVKANHNSAPPAHQKLLEGKSIDPTIRLRGPNEKRGLHHPTNPVKYAPPTSDAPLKPEKKKTQKKQSDAERLISEIDRKQPPKIYRHKKERSAAWYESQGLDPSNWQHTLKDGLSFAMYPSHNPTSEVSPSRAFMVGNKGNKQDEGSPNGWTTNYSTASFHHYESIASAYTELPDGTIRRDEKYKTADKILAASRHNVEKLDKHLSRLITLTYDRYMGLCERLSNEANRKSIEVYKKLLYKIRWANPPMPMSQQGLINDYVLHLLGMPDAYGRRPKFRGEALMRQGFHKHVATSGEKDYTEILVLINRIRSIVLHNDGQVDMLKSSLATKQSKMTIQKSSTLRWKMETNTGRRDRFWTSWFFAMRGMPAELHRHLSARKKESLRIHLERFGGGLAGEEGWKQKLARDDAWQRGDTLNDCDERDPDFGLTALHYASKQSNIDVVKILLAHGANPNMRAPDGRTALHFAAAYSTRAVCLELLGAEADIDAVDEYGCKAIHLAEQNENRSTYVTLEKWRHLVPPQEPLVNRPQSSADTFYDRDGEGSISTTDGAETILSHNGSLAEMSYANYSMGEFDLKSYLLIPDEYKPIDEERISKMSRPLRAIAYRLKVPQWVLQQLPDGGIPPGLEAANDADDADDAGASSSSRAPEVDLDPMTEIRLCGKVAEGCFSEGFVPEGIQVLRRRWKLARLLLAGNSATTAAAAAASHGHLEVERPAKNAVAGGLEGRALVTSTLQGNSVSHAATAVMNKHGAGGRLTSAAFSLHACVDMGVQLAEALIRHGQEGFAATILAETFLLSNNSPTIPGGNGRVYSAASSQPDAFGTQHRGVDKYSGLWTNNAKHNASTASVFNASINNSVGAEDNVTTHSLSITSQYLGREKDLKTSNLSAALGNTWGGKSAASHDYMEPSVAVSLLARRCEILLCVWDLLLIDSKETPRTSPFPMPAKPPQSVLQRVPIQPPQATYAHTASAAGSIDKVLYPQSHENNNAFSRYEFGNSQAEQKDEVMRNADGSSTKSALATGYYDGKGKKNIARDPVGFSAAKSIDGQNYQTYSRAIDLPLGKPSGNPQAYNYSSTYKDYVGRYLEHQSQYIEELRKDLTEDPAVEYEPANADADEITDEAKDNSLAKGDQDYNHQILVDNFGRPLQDPPPGMSTPSLRAEEGSAPAAPFSQSVTFGASVVFEDGGVGVTKGSVETSDSAAWYDPDFKLSPSRAYMDRLTRSVHNSPSPSQRSESLTEGPSISVRPKTMGDLKAQESFISYGYEGEDYQLYQRILGVASETRICAENAINIALQTTSHLLVEPVVLAPLLEILAECYERENNYEDSLACLVRAETITRRTVGTDTIESITIMTNVLRMLIKCETKAGQEEAVLKAQELNRVVYRFNQGIESEKQADLKRRQREKDLGRNFIITEEGAIVLNPDRPSLMQQREEKAQREKMGIEDDSSVASTLYFNEKEAEATALFNSAIELISLSKLLECGYEKMDTFDVRTEEEKFLSAREKPSYYSVQVASTGSIRPNPKNKKVSEERMAKSENVKQALSKPKDARKKYVVTGRSTVVEDKSQKLSIATGFEVKGFGDPDVDPEADPELDGGLSQVFNSQGQRIQNHSKKIKADTFSTRSAALAPHEHVSNVKEDISKQKKRVEKDDGTFVLVAPKIGRKGESLYDAKDNTKNELAAQLATTSINAGRYLQRRRYLKVSEVPILEKRRVFLAVDAPTVVEPNQADVSSKFYRQLQHRALTLEFKHAKPQLATSSIDSSSQTRSFGNYSTPRSINNSINNSILIQQNADGTKRISAGSSGAASQSAYDSRFDASMHSNSKFSNKSFDGHEKGSEDLSVRPRVFEKPKHASASEGIIISNLALLIPDDLTAVQMERSIGTLDSMRFREALNKERALFEEQESDRQKQSGELEEDEGNDEALDGDKRAPKPWILPRSPTRQTAERPTTDEEGKIATGRYSQANISSDLAVNSPYVARGMDLSVSAKVQYDNMYGVAAEGRREQAKENALERERMRVQQEKNAVLIAKAEESAEMYKSLELRVHPLAEVHRAHQGETDSKYALQEQERAVMRSMAGIQSLLQSHPGLAGLLPTEGVNLRTSSRTSVPTRTGVEALRKKNVLLDDDHAEQERLIPPREVFPDDIAMQLSADAAKYVGAIMTTGHSLVSIPHVHRLLDSDGDRVRDGPKTPPTDSAQGVPQSRITNKQLKENKSLLRFKNGEWKYETNQTESDASAELRRADVREIQHCLDLIAEEKALQEPVKWHV